jgi:hypothetical protein
MGVGRQVGQRKVAARILAFGIGSQMHPDCAKDSDFSRFARSRRKTWYGSRQLAAGSAYATGILCRSAMAAEPGWLVERLAERLKKGGGCDVCCAANGESPAIVALRRRWPEVIVRSKIFEIVRAA